MGPTEIAFIKQTFDMSSRELARALGVAPFTVARWETGQNKPTGLQVEVLRALHQAAQKTAAQRDDSARRFAGGLIALGVGALIFAALTADEPTVPAPRRRTRT